jgi:hypothetical protein
MCGDSGIRTSQSSSRFHCTNNEGAEVSNKYRGLYEKYTVRRNDGESAPCGVHHGCEYFVLDLTHDKHAKAALAAYAESCAAEYPQLAEDLREKVVTAPFGPKP